MLSCLCAGLCASCCLSKLSSFATGQEILPVQMPFTSHDAQIQCVINTILPEVIGKIKPSLQLKTYILPQREERQIFLRRKGWINRTHQMAHTQYVYKGPLWGGGLDTWSTVLNETEIHINVNHFYATYQMIGAEGCTIPVTLILTHNTVCKCTYIHKLTKTSL